MKKLILLLVLTTFTSISKAQDNSAYLVNFKSVDPGFSKPVDNPSYTAEWYFPSTAPLCIDIQIGYSANYYNKKNRFLGSRAGILYNKSFINIDVGEYTGSTKVQWKTLILSNPPRTSKTVKYSYYFRVRMVNISNPGDIITNDERYTQSIKRLIANK